jgi:hypothetical protein
VQRRAVGQDQRAASTDSWLCEEVHRLYNKRATGRKAMERDSARRWTMGLQCRYFRGTDTWEAYAAGAVHSEESAAAVSNMQQRQSAGFHTAEGIAERVLAMCGFKGVGAGAGRWHVGPSWAQSARSQPACWSRLPAGHWPI